MLLTDVDVRRNLAEYLRKRRKALGLSREALSGRSTVSASTLKKFETTGQISLRQFLLLWESLDSLERINALTREPAAGARVPASIEEVLNDPL